MKLQWQNERSFDSDEVEILRRSPVWRWMIAQLENHPNLKREVWKGIVPGQEHLLYRFQGAHEVLEAVFDLDKG